jgi:hypothetical protein
MRKGEVISVLIVLIVGGVVAWQVLGSINEGEVSGRVYEIGDGKICLSGGGLWEFKYHGDNYPEVGRYIEARYENGDTIVWWKYYQPRGISYLLQPIVVLTVLTIVLLFIGCQKGWLRR